MRKSQHRRPFYRRPWLWIGLIAILIAGGGLMIANSQQQESVQEETKEKAKKGHKSKKKSDKKAKQQAKTSSESQMDKAAAAPQTKQNGTNTGNTQPAAGTDTSSHQHEPWVDPDNYEPNSIVGDRSTMRCYLPGQSPYPAIAQENLVYFDFLAEAQAAGYSTGQ